MFTKEELNSKKISDLATIAEDLGLVLVAENTTKPTYIKLIMEAQEEDQAIEIVPVETAPELKEVKEAPEKRYRISVSNQDGPESTAFIKVCVNNMMYTIPRETEVVVPASVVEVLNNAITTRYVQEGREVIARPAKRFPFSILGEVVEK